MYKSLRQQTLHYFARPQQSVRLEPLTGPQAWRGEDLRQRDDWIDVLGDDDVEELKQAVVAAESTGKSLGDLGRGDFPLPRLATRIAAWRREVRRGRGFVLVRGIPVRHWSQTQAEIAYWCLGQHLGMPGAQNPQGDLLGHVRDQRTGEDVRLYRTNQAIKVHCDAADVVGLLCLKAARSGGLSRLASSVTVYNELLRSKPHLVPRLYQPLYFDTKGEAGIRAFPVAPCAYADGELRTFWQSDYYRSAPRLPEVPALTDQEQELLDSYDAIADSPEIHLDMALEPGDLQLVSNHSILHARTAYEDHPEPEQRRHLLRLWLSLPEARPLHLRYLVARSWMSLAWRATRQLMRTRPLADAHRGAGQSSLP